MCWRRPETFNQRTDENLCRFPLEMKEIGNGVVYETKVLKKATIRSGVNRFGRVINNSTSEATLQLKRNLSRTVFESKNCRAKSVKTVVLSIAQ